MSRAVTIELDVDDAQAVKAWQRGKQAIAEFDKQGGKAKKTFGEMFASSTKSVLASAAGFAGVGSAIGGIAQAASLIRSEYDALITRQQNAARTQLSLADAERQLSENIGFAANLPLDEKRAIQADVIRRRDRIAQDANVSPLAATLALADTLSARGKGTIDQSEKAVTSAFLVSPNPDAVNALSAGTLDLARSGADPENAAQFLVNSGSVLRLTQGKDVAKTVARSVNAGTNFGDDEREVLGLLSFLTKEGTDETGQPSGTALLQLESQVRELLPDVNDTITGLQKIAADEKLRTKFLGDLTGEQRFRPGVEKLVSDPNALAEVIAVRDSVAGFADSARLLADNEKLLSELPTAATRQAARVFDSTTARLEAGDPTGVSSIFREGSAKVALAAGEGATRSKILGIVDELESGFGTDPRALRDSAVQRFSALARQTGDRIIPGQTVFSGFGSTQTPAERVTGTARENEVKEILLQMVAELKELNIRDAAGGPPLEITVNGRKAPSTIKTPAGPRKHSRLNSPPVTAGGTR